MNLDLMIEHIAEQALYPGLAHGVHGESHWRRTFRLAEMIMSETGGHRHIVGYASLLHDIGRLHSDNDGNHGYRGVPATIRIVMSQYARTQKAGMDLYGTMVTIGKIAEIVARHCFPDIPDYLEMKVVYDANILDRVRFGGAIDVSRFAFPDVSTPLIDTAIALLDEDPVAEPPTASIVQLEKKLIIPKGVV